LLLPAPAASGSRQDAGRKTGKPVLMRLKFKQGEKTRYQTTMHAEIAVPLPGQNKPMRNVIDMDMLQQQEVVKALPDGGRSRRPSSSRTTGSTGILRRNNPCRRRR